MSLATPAAGRSISAADFECFRAFFYRKTGIHFDLNKRYFVDKRLIQRMDSTGAADFRAYFLALRFETSGAELQRLVNSMTVNETYFFRESYQLDCLVNDLMPAVAARKRPGQRIRIWSVPSSTGEEPYSIAMHLLERWSGIHEHDVEILSSDIDTTALDAARRGVYGQRAVAQLPPAYLEKYFERRGAEWVISRDIAHAVEFSPVNLCDPQATRSWRDIDVVFCRNLLIYFDDQSRRVAADAIYDALAPGGFVCLGHSESMSRISPLFEVRRFADATVYQKPPTGERA